MFCFSDESKKMTKFDTIPLNSSSKIITPRPNWTIQISSTYDRSLLVQPCDYKLTRCSSFDKDLQLLLLRSVYKINNYLT